MQNDISNAMMWSKSKPDVEFQYGRRLGEFNGMSSQSHLPHCRVLPPGEFSVMNPELRVTLQGAATWWIHCQKIPEPHATLQGVRIPSAILKIVFSHILFLFLFLMQFRLWRAAAFVSSPIHLFIIYYFVYSCWFLFSDIHCSCRFSEAVTRWTHWS